MTGSNQVKNQFFDSCQKQILVTVIFYGNQTTSYKFTRPARMPARVHTVHFEHWARTAQSGLAAAAASCRKRGSGMREAPSTPPTDTRAAVMLLPAVAPPRWQAPQARGL